jgi:pSer/pThr/pTyr-binding forkhead associated (FHA) protein
MHVRLKVIHGKYDGREFKLPMPKCVVGREAGCELRINNEAISRKHCVIMTSASSIIVRELHSRNGTFVNDTRVLDETRLSHGDILKVGPIQFEALIEQSEKLKRR